MASSVRCELGTKDKQGRKCHGFFRLHMPVAAVAQFTGATPKDASLVLEETSEPPNLGFHRYDGNVHLPGRPVDQGSS
ncbi:MAG: hypothetical protein V7727_20800 [Sneathiella sp.]